MDKAEKMIYQENKMGATFVVMFILLNMAFTIFNLKSMPVNLELGGFVMYNILVSLFGFLASTKMKVYLIKWGYAGIVIGVIQFFRLLVIPEGYEPSLDLGLKALVITSAISIIIGSVITINRSKIKDAYELKLEKG